MGRSTGFAAVAWAVVLAACGSRAPTAPAPTAIDVYDYDGARTGVIDQCPARIDCDSTREIAGVPLPGGGSGLAVGGVAGVVRVWNIEALAPP